MRDSKNSVIYILTILSILFIIYESFIIYKLSDAIYTSKDIIIKLQDRYNHTLLSAIKYKNSRNDFFKEDLSKIQKWISTYQSEIAKINKKDIEAEFLLLKKCWSITVLKVEEIKRCYTFYKHIVDALKNCSAAWLKDLQSSITLLITALIILLILGFKLIKLYIDKELEENIIYDTESRLYSYYYCVDIIRKLCSHSDRTKRPISAIFIEFPELEKYHLDDKKKILEIVGEFLTSTIRLSDIACRYGQSSFLILMPNTESSIPLKRIQEGLGNYLKESFPECKIKVSSSERSIEEDCKEFIKRSTISS